MTERSYTTTSIARRRPGKCHWLYFESIKSSTMFSVTVKLAIWSRLIILLIQFVGNHLIPDHNAGVFLSPKSPSPKSVCNSVIDAGFGGLRRWDAEYFLHIAEYGYTYENTLAFYPLFPFATHYTTLLFQNIIPASMRCSKRNLLLLSAVILNLFFFAMAARTLRQLSEHVLGDKRKAKIAIILFCFNPASIFFTAPYSESLFAWLSFAAMLKCVEEKFWSASVPLALAILCRSNGTMNIGFLLYFCAQRTFSGQRVNVLDLLEQCRKVLIILVALALLFAAMQFYFYSLYCIKQNIKYPRFIQEYGRVHHLVLAGSRRQDLHASPWCEQPFALSYSYIQSHYWNVGFLNYYEWKQLPNFALATPILFLFMFNCLRYLKGNVGQALHLGLYKVNDTTRQTDSQAKLFVFMVHAFVLTAICIAVVHIQVSTRMLASSSPLLYWLSSRYVTMDDRDDKDKESERIHDILLSFLKINLKNRAEVFIKLWFLSYFCIGTVLFANFLPWT